MHRRDLLQLLGVSAVAAAAGIARTVVPAPVAASRQRVASAGARPDVELALTAAPGEVAILPGEPTRVWRFGARLLSGPPDTLRILPGSYLGPVIRLRRGQRVRVRFSNQLAEDSIVHWHGLDVPQDADGHPRLAIGHGHEYVYDFEVTNRAGTYWYHPHPHMRTGPQVYQGLAGLLIVEDPEEARLELPSGDAEHLCVIQDRRFDGRNQFVYHGGGMMDMMNGFVGDRILVNGLPQPSIDVDQGWQRLRLLNGSNARIYKLAWDRTLPMTIIGSDGGLLERPLARSVLTLAPAQRLDVLVDLSAVPPGASVHLESLAYPEADAGIVGMMGMRGTGPTTARNGAPMRILTLRPRARRSPAFRLPERLSTFEPHWSDASAAPTRVVPLTFMRMQWLIGGRTFAMDDVAAEEAVTAGSTHARMRRPSRRARLVRARECQVSASGADAETGLYFLGRLTGGTMPLAR